MPIKLLKDSRGRLYTDAITKKPIAVDMPDIQNNGLPFEATTEEEMTALITTENEGKIVLYSGETGEYVNGEYYKITSSGDNTQYYELAELTSPATAEDIASGKEAYGADGAVITGTAEGYTVVRGTIIPSSKVQTIQINNIPREPKFVQVKVSGSIEDNCVNFITTSVYNETNYSTNGWRGGTMTYFVSNSANYKVIAPYLGEYDIGTQTVTLDAGSGRYYRNTTYNYVIVY